MADWPLLGITRAFGDDTSPAYEKQLTNPGGAHVKSAWTQFVAATPASASMLLLAMNAAANNDCLFDIGVGAAGSEQVVIPNLYGNGGAEIQNTVVVPIYIPAGVRVSARVQSNIAAINLFLKMIFLSEAFYGIQPPSRWEDWGTDTANSRGTTLTANAAANTKGTAVQLKAASGFTSKWILSCIMSLGSVAQSSVDLMVGTQVVIPDMNATNQHRQTYFTHPFTIPAGSQVQARTMSAVGGSTVRVAFWGGA